MLKNEKDWIWNIDTSFIILLLKFFFQKSFFLWRNSNVMLYFKEHLKSLYWIFSCPFFLHIQMTIYRMCKIRLLFLLYLSFIILQINGPTSVYLITYLYFLRSNFYFYCILLFLLLFFAFLLLWKRQCMLLY